MPQNDFAICSGMGCPLRDTCRRAIAFDNPWEYNYAVEPAYGTNGFCYCVNYMGVNDGKGQNL